MQTPFINTIVSEWIVFGIGVTMSIVSAVMVWLKAGDFSPYGYLGLALAVLGIILTRITGNDLKKAGLKK